MAQPLRRARKAKGKGKDGKGKEGKGKKGEKGGGKSSSAPTKKGPCFYCQKPGHTKAECRKRLADLKKAEGKGRTAAAAPEGPGPEGESVAASALCVAAPAAELGNCKHKLLVDTGAGGGLAPKGFECEAVSVADSQVSMRTVTGEPLKLGRKRCSTMSTADIGVKFHYRESEDVKFPVISMSEASDKGTWLVIGPKVQYLLCNSEGKKLHKVLEELHKTPLLKEKGVCWLEAQGHEVQYPKDVMVAPAPKEENSKGTFVAPVAKEVRVVEEAVESSPSEVEADPFGDAPLGEDPEPKGDEGRQAKYKKVPPKC